MSSGRVSTTGPGRPDVATAEREGTGDEFRDAGSIVDLADPFREFGEGAAEFHFLEGLALAGVALNLTDEEDHRDRILPGDMQACGGIGCARAAGDHADAWLSRQPAPGICHHRRTTLLTADKHLDVAVMQRIEHGKKALARHAGNTRYAIGLQSFDDELAARSLHIFAFPSSSANSARTSS